MEDEVDEFLAHYGVTGMKWGVRKGSVKSRLKGAASDAVERQLVTNKSIANGTAQTRDYRRAIVKGGTFGVVTGPRKKSAAKRVERLEGLQTRIDTGKTGVMDKIGLAYNISPGDLVVSRRDKRALPGSPPDKVNNGRQKAAKILAGTAGAVAIAAMNNPRNRAVAVNVLKLAANDALGAAMKAKQASNARKSAATARSNTHGLATGPTIRLQQNPTTGNWV